MPLVTHAACYMPPVERTKAFHLAPGFQPATSRLPGHFLMLGVKNWDSPLQILFNTDTRRIQWSKKRSSHKKRQLYLIHARRIYWISKEEAVRESERQGIQTLTLTVS